MPKLTDSQLVWFKELNEFQEHVQQLMLEVQMLWKRETKITLKNCNRNFLLFKGIPLQQNWTTVKFIAKDYKTVSLKNLSFYEDISQLLSNSFLRHGIYNVV